MRHNDARKWLHAVLDLLPVLLIPVFMIYSHRHTLTEQTTVDIQYKFQSNEVNNDNDLVEGNIYHFEINNDSLAYHFNFNSSSYISLKFYNVSNYDFYNLELSQDETLYSGDGLDDIVCIIDFTSSETVLSIYLNNNDYFTTYYGEQAFQSNTFTLIGECVINEKSSITISDNDVFSYTDYNVIESVDVHDQTSSVMNVFMDNFNNAVDKYFNMGNVFNMTNVYQWFETNIFGGTAPTVIYSVWNIVLYEFVMDLLFLLYGLFMWFIDMCKRLMEKPLDSIK